MTTTITSTLLRTTTPFRTSHYLKNGTSTRRAFTTNYSCSQQQQQQQQLSQEELTATMTPSVVSLMASEEPPVTLHNNNNTAPVQHASSIPVATTTSTNVTATATTTTTTTTSVSQKKKGFFSTMYDIYSSKTNLINNMILSGKSVSPNAFLAIMFGAFRMKQTFQQKKFEHRITISLNYIDFSDPSGSPTLKIRNLACDNLDNVLLQNMEAVHVVQEAAKTSTSDKPVVMLSTDDKWFILNMIQTKISQQLSPDGFFLKDLGIPCRCEMYVFGITNEPDAEVKKMRVVIVKEQLLIDILKQKYGPIDIKPGPHNLINNSDNDPDCKTSSPRFEYKAGQHRWKTLVQMARLYNAQQEEMTKTGQADLMRVEVCLPIYFQNSRVAEHYPGKMQV